MVGWCNLHGWRPEIVLYWLNFITEIECGGDWYVNEEAAFDRVSLLGTIALGFSMLL